MRLPKLRRSLRFLKQRLVDRERSSFPTLGSATPQEVWKSALTILQVCFRVDVRNLQSYDLIADLKPGLLDFIRESHAWKPIVTLLRQHRVSWSDDASVGDFVRAFDAVESDVHSRARETIHWIQCWWDSENDEILAILSSLAVRVDSPLDHLERQLLDSHGITSTVTRVVYETISGELSIPVGLLRLEDTIDDEMMMDLLGWIARQLKQASIRMENVVRIQYLNGDGTTLSRATIAEFIIAIHQSIVA